jgi:hypothetical protein
MRRDFTPTDIEKLAGVDPLREFFAEALSTPTNQAVRSELVIELVVHLHRALTDPDISEAQAYETFARVVALLNVFLPEGRSQ